MKKLIIAIAVGLLKFINLFFRPIKLKKQVVIISRQSDVETMDIKMLREGLEQMNIKVKVLCRKLNGASYAFHMLKQMKEINASKVIVLDSYCILASILPKKKGQSTIQIWHALGAIKKFGWQSAGATDGRSLDVSEGMKMHAGYDYFLAPSTETEGYFREAFRSDGKGLRIGLPRIDYLRAEDIEVAEKIKETYPVVCEKINVLYVPTFRRNAAIEMESLVDAFDFEKFNLIIKKHFLDKGDYSFAREKGAIVDDKFTSFEWFRVSEKVVTDYSAISLEAAIAEKELYIYQPDNGKYSENTGLNMDLSKEAIGKYFAKTEAELIATLEKGYDKNDVLAYRDKYFEIDLDDCTGQLCNFISSMEDI